MGFWGKMGFAGFHPDFAGISTGFLLDFDWIFFLTGVKRRE